jgi:hypothetical protein
VRLSPGEWLVGVDELGDQGAVVEEVAVAEKLALHADPRLTPQPFCLERIAKQALDCAAEALEVVRVLYEQARLAIDDLVDDPTDGAVPPFAGTEVATAAPATRRASCEGASSSRRTRSRPRHDPIDVDPQPRA